MAKQFSSTSAHAFRESTARNMAAELPSSGKRYPLGVDCFQIDDSCATPTFLSWVDQQFQASRPTEAA